ncbi:hypothetical protein F8388_010324 [Cannabis sativa]|uniref:Uncharacterized protein n=1 Tax=Cannabis sativa TaxID=3483 RepID=A0A7J6GSM0_CANSA|nr:hypothetical protein F8388_010324 [Cannabis sativa]
MADQEHVRKEDVRINVDAVVTKLASMISKDDLCRSSKCCIFKVPRILLRHNPKAYTPIAFSIGPFHYGEEHLRDTQNIKLKYLYDLVSRFVDQGTSTEKKLILMDLTEAMSEIWEEARECYAGPINMSKDEFVQMLVLDGCFLIELFYRYKELFFRSEEANLTSNKDDPIFSVNTMIQVLHHDLILLENQIPWVVLACLYELITKQVINQLPLDLLVLIFFNGTFSRKAGLLQHEDHMIQSITDFMERKHKHILDLLRNSMVGVKKDNHNNNINWQQLPSATILQEAGIKFKATTKASLLDIQFRKGVLEIPPLHIHETTESLLRNLICFEQCLPNCKGKITSYAILLDNLINTSKDMEILCKRGVVDNWLNNEEATEFFNQLYNDTFVNYFHYSKLIVDVNEHCGHRWPKYRRVLMHDYFKHPWALTSVFAAAILLFLTFLQTLFTILYK